MIYPQCFNGYMVPMITGDGFLQPCCQVGQNYRSELWTIGEKTTIPNPFIDPDFNLHNNTYADIVESDKWNNMIVGLKHTKLYSCSIKCGSKNDPRNSPFGIEDDWIDKQILTKDLNTIQIETSTRCTLECMYCSRQVMNKQFKSEWLNRYDLPVEIIEDVFFYKKWDTIIDCGTYGDPIYYKHYHDMLEFMSYAKIKHYRVSIAATGKTQKWWDKTHELWKHLHDNGTYIIIFWGIDGLEDTSKIHRINQDWNEISTQMRRSSKNGLWSTWQYIPMRFNEHQIEEARQLSKDWGVKFFLKPSDRFTKPGDPNKPVNTNLYYQMKEENGIRYHMNKPTMLNINN